MGIPPWRAVAAVSGTVAHLHGAAKRKLEPGCQARQRLASRVPLLYESAIMITRNTATARPTGFAVETARALCSALLLLGLIGDRRVR